MHTIVIAFRELFFLDQVIRKVPIDNLPLADHPLPLVRK